MFQQFFSWLFREYPPLHNLYDRGTVVLNATGGLLISITFLIIGIVFIFNKKTNEKTALRQRIIISKLIGFSLVLCGIARAIDVGCMWINLANLNGLFKTVTGILGIMTVTYIPHILRVIKKQITLEDIKNTMQKVHNKLEQIEEINKDLHHE